MGSEKNSYLLWVGYCWCHQCCSSADSHCLWLILFVMVLVGYWVQGWKGLLAKGYPLPCGLQKIPAVLALLFVLFIAVSVRGCTRVWSEETGACVGPFPTLPGKCTSSHIQWHLLPLSMGKSSTNRLRFSSNLLLGFKLFTALSFGLQLLCISNTPNQLFVKFEIQDILIGHAALKE